MKHIGDAKTETLSAIRVLSSFFKREREREKKKKLGRVNFSSYETNPNEETLTAAIPSDLYVCRPPTMTADEMNGTDHLTARRQIWTVHQVSIPQIQ